MSSSDRITCSKGKSEGFSIPYKTNRGKGKGRKSTNQQDQPDMAQQSTSATDRVQQLQQQAVVPTLTVITTSHQAYFLSVYYRSLSWRMTTLQGTTCSRCSRRLSTVNTPHSLAPGINGTARHHQPEQAHHRYHFKQYHKILVHIYL